MRVLIVGGTRFVGYLTAWRLVARGDQVTLFHRGSAEGSAPLEPFAHRVERVLGDRTTDDLAKLLDARGSDFDAIADFAAYEGAHVERVLERLDKQHYLFVSSGQVYNVRVPRPARAASEDDYDGPLMAEPTDPAEHGQWSYGMGKRACEDALRSYANATSLRIPVVNGERDYYRRIEHYLWKLLHGETIGVPDKRVRHVYGDDVARFIAEQLGNAKTFGRAFNLAQKETPTLPELMQLLAKLMGARARVEIDDQVKSPFNTAWMSFIDPTRAERELGFEQTPLETYLTAIIASFKASPPTRPV